MIFDFYVLGPHKVEITAQLASDRAILDRLQDFIQTHGDGATALSMLLDEAQAHKGGSE